MNDYIDNDNIKLTEQDCEFFGGSILMFLFFCAFGHLIDLPEELKIKIEELKNKGSDITEEDLDKIKPLVNDYYNKVKEEFYE